MLYHANVASGLCVGACLDEINGHASIPGPWQLVTLRLEKGKRDWTGRTKNWRPTGSFFFMNQIPSTTIQICRSGHWTRGPLFLFHCFRKSMARLWPVGRWLIGLLVEQLQCIAKSNRCGGRFIIILRKLAKPHAPSARRRPLAREKAGPRTSA